MTELQLAHLFKIPDGITASEFARRTGKTESSVRHMMDRRLLPMVTERELLGPDGSARRILILWNEWLEMVHLAAGSRPVEAHGWKDSWIEKAKKLSANMGMPASNQGATA
ncbi:Cox family DNA-binding protein [Yersinia vastinensis]|uniref:Cox family DNA-binding protein n=1 Tax=Yersinia vastinensis TaxID=2890318 RepID=UPI00119EB513|nr:Cox family DNA-binding protein [Yersinia vastinensis]